MSKRTLLIYLTLSCIDSFPLLFAYSYQGSITHRLRHQVLHDCITMTMSSSWRRDAHFYLQSIQVPAHRMTPIIIYTETKISTDHITSISRRRHGIMEIIQLPRSLQTLSPSIVMWWWAVPGQRWTLAKIRSLISPSEWMRSITPLAIMYHLVHPITMTPRRCLPVKKASTKCLAFANSFTPALCTSLICNKTDADKTAWNETHRDHEKDNLSALYPSLMCIETNADNKAWNETSYSSQKWQA